MQKAKTYNIAETNLANFGTEMEKNIKHAAAEGEQAWHETGKEPGLLIWRIEKFKVVKSKAPVGSFFDGDSYIVLHTYKQDDKLKFDVHFWLGQSTSQDEAGTAAYKTVELDDHLKGAAVQHREVQDHESALFLSYFKEVGGIKILQGGMESGFHHVKPEEYVPRLLWIKGKKNVRVKEVEKHVASLNDGDVFILDTGLKLFQWNGKQSGGSEKMRAAQLVRAMDSERDGKTSVIVMDEGSEEPEFWEALGGKGTVKTQEEVENDSEWEHAVKKELYRFSDVSGKMEFTQVAEGDNVKKSLLVTTDGFIFDNGNQIYIWLGKGATLGETKYAMKYAQEYMKAQDRPSFLPISRVNEGHEPNHFYDQFPK